MEHEYFGKVHKSGHLKLFANENTFELEKPMKRLNITRIETVKSVNNGKNFNFVVRTDNGEQVSLAMPYDLELDMMLPLQIASNDAARKRGSESIGCHRAMKPSQVGIISDANGTSILQFTFSDRNKLDVIVPLTALAKIKEKAIEFQSTHCAKSALFVN